MGRGKGAPVASPAHLYSHLAPQPLHKQKLVAQFFDIGRCIYDPYLQPSCPQTPLAALRSAAAALKIKTPTPAPTQQEEVAQVEEEQFMEDTYSYSDSPDFEEREKAGYEDEYLDEWDDLAWAADRAATRCTRRRAVSRERLTLERTAGRQRHEHVSHHQVQRAERQVGQRVAQQERKAERGQRLVKHPETVPSAICTARMPATTTTRTVGRSTSSGRSPTERMSTTAVLHTATGRHVQLSREEQEVAAAIQASLAMDANAAGGLNMAQLSELLTRDLSPNDYELLLLLDESVAKKTCKADSIERLATRTATEADVTCKCTICQMEYEAGESLRTTPCQHTFHADCLQTWLTKSSTKCALCNKSIEAEA